MQDLLTAPEAARFLGLHRDTVLRLAREGAIPAARVGGRWRFDRELLETWVRAGGGHYDALCDRGLAEVAAERAAKPDYVSEEVVAERLGL